MSNLVKVTVNGTTNLVSAKIYQAQNGATGATGATGSTGATGAAGPNSVTSATTSDSTCALTVASLNGNTIATGTGTIILGTATIQCDAGAGNFAFGGSIQTNGGGGNNAEGGSISTYGGSSANASGGVISTQGGTLPGGGIDTSDGGGAINTTAGGSLTTGTGDLTGPAASGTLALTSDISLLPQNSKSAAYTTVLADAGKSIYHPSADTTARIFTIDSNANVAYPIGTAITFINDTSAGVITIAITSDTLVLAGAGTTGSRTLAANGMATAVKMTSTRWMISGAGLT